MRHKANEHTVLSELANENKKSEAVREFMSRKPGFIIRYGTALFLIIFIIVIFISWFIQYPNIVTVNARLNSTNTHLQTTYFAETYIPQINIGQVKTGQQVQLKFDAYPSERFGSIVGQIVYVSPVYSDSGYKARISLPNQLVTTYRKKIEYRNGLTSHAEIITQNQRLLLRLYHDSFQSLKP